MNSILRVLRGNWLVVAVCMTASLIGGILVIVLLPPRYAATARVVLDYFKPDPITGAVIHSKAVDAYLSSQLRLLRDVQVAGPAVEALGWLDNPELQAAYAAQAGADRDFESWVASLLIVGTNAYMVEDSNIMEISYTSTSPELAVAGVEALRDAYIESSIVASQVSARTSAEWLAGQAERVKGEIAKLEQAQAKIEDANGLLIGSNGGDGEGLLLRNLARQRSGPVLADSSRLPPSQALLAAADAELAAAGQQLGPNHPKLNELRQRRETLAAQVAAEAAVIQAKGSAAELANRVSQALLEQQKEKVLSKRVVSTELRLLQDEIVRRTDQLNELTAAMVQNRDVALTSTTTLKPIGPPTPKDHAVFPNKPLILIAALVAGALLGSLISLLLELNLRRIRAVTDLEAATHVPVLAVVPRYRLAMPKARWRPRPVRPSIGSEVPAE